MRIPKNDIKLVFAIGNPEEEYSNTRHNIGIYFLKKVIKEMNACLTYKNKFTSFVSKHEEIIFAISNAYMNTSGYILSSILQYYKVNPNQILVIQDDMLLGLCDIQLKFNGSAHGHNGIKNINQQIKSDKYFKLKIGIGKPKNRMDNTSHVLGKFKEEERKIINKRVDVIISEIKQSNFLNVIKNMKK